MLTKKEKAFFLRTAQGASTVSSATVGRGAVLVKGNKIIGTGYNREIIKGHRWEISAICDAIFSARDVNLAGTSLFSTYFPNIEDIKLIIATGVSRVYFYGKIDDPETTELLNSFKQGLGPIELIQLN